MTIAIDLGISATKVVLMEGTKVHNMELWEGIFSTDRLTDYIRRIVSPLGKARRIALTGIGSKNLMGPLCGIPTEKVDEFRANSVAAGLHCQKYRYLVCSMGSGTSFVLIDGDNYKHLGGSAMGGGTLHKLFQLMLPGGGWVQLRSLAEKGQLSRIDQQIRDLSHEELPNLPMDTTATNLGKASQASKPEDATIGLVNMVVQNIGVMAHLAGHGYGVKDFVMIGRMTTLPQVREIFNRLEQLYGIRIIIPENAEYMTAIGAALNLL